jgi:hypothetical protein
MLLRAKAHQLIRESGQTDPVVMLAPATRLTVFLPAASPLCQSRGPMGQTRSATVRGDQASGMAAWKGATFSTHGADVHHMDYT